MNRPDNVIPLHRGVAPRSGERILGDPDAVFIRARQQRNLEQFEERLARQRNQPEGNGAWPLVWGAAAALYLLLIVWLTGGVL